MSSHRPTRAAPIWPIWPGELVLHAQGLAGRNEFPQTECRAVVSQQAFDAHSKPLVVRYGAAHRKATACGAFSSGCIAVKAMCAWSSPNGSTQQQQPACACTQQTSGQSVRNFCELATLLAIGKILAKIWQYSKNKKVRYALHSRLPILETIFLVGPARFELATNGLKVRCSTD